MNGQAQYGVLVSAYSRNHLLDQGRKNGVTWDEDNDEGINWLRFSMALVKFLNEGNAFYTDDADEETLNRLLESYSQIREIQKKLMIPHLRAAMSKISSERGTDVEPMEVLQEAYELLDRCGGTVWADKVQNLVGINKNIANLNTRLGKNTEGSTQGTPV